MPPLHKMRQGWQSENLARFILYKFSFVSEPSKIADDIGVDFFCTFFIKAVRSGGDWDLLPKSSFAIQVKSDKRSFRLTKHLHYLSSLEIPFFVGVASKRDLSLTIYSGEYLRHFFALFGPEDPVTHTPHAVKAKLCDRSTFDPLNGWWSKDSKREFTLMVPKVVEIEARSAADELDRSIAALQSVSESIQNNVASTISHRFMLEVYGTNHRIPYMGPGSLPYFETNFADALIEVFLNLGHLFGYPELKSAVQQLFPTYETIYNEFKQAYPGDSTAPNELDIRYQHAKSIIDSITTK